MKLVLHMALAAMLGLPAAAQSKPTTFNSVPANIADAPVDIWRGVRREDRNQVFRWRLAFDGGNVWISAIHPGSYWPEAPFASESRMARSFKKDGFENVRRLESVAYAGSQWGYMAVADWRSKVCVVGTVLDNDNFDHDGSGGGTLQGFAADCGFGAVGRFDKWRTWFRSFKRVPLGYNGALDR